MGVFNSSTLKHGEEGLEIKAVKIHCGMISQRHFLYHAYRTVYILDIVKVQSTDNDYIQKKALVKKNNDLEIELSR